MGDNRCRTWPRECKVCGRMVHLTNFMCRSAITLVGNLVRSNTHEIKCKKWKGLPRSEERFAGRMSNAEQISLLLRRPGQADWSVPPAARRRWCWPCPRSAPRAGQGPRP